MAVFWVLSCLTKIVLFKSGIKYKYFYLRKWKFCCVQKASKELKINLKIHILVVSYHGPKTEYKSKII